jgi:hypothetical protein
MKSRDIPQTRPVDRNREICKLEMQKHVGKTIAPKEKPLYQQKQSPNQLSTCKGSTKPVIQLYDSQLPSFKSLHLALE